MAVTYDFQDKTAFVTGAAGGIGRARAFAQAGAAVGLADIDENIADTT